MRLACGSTIIRATASANKRLQNRRKSSGSKSPTRNYPSNAENQQYLSNAQPSPKKWASAVPKSTKSNVSANSPTKVNRCGFDGGGEF
ncbi:hypothetical protein TL16_g04683 [Triparma laevis f. inornata]|uniref:Uncharacterized protein n=1 Tax=Triparma laevis f. inornata TaxID=1714386 RepID=A0A9W7A7P2_9STRA|nr:hypothetical protein TL16_g04683 [Triparma laevis f. inornata]